MVARYNRRMAKRWLELVPVLDQAIEGDAETAPLHGVAVLSPAGEPVGTAGALAHYEVRALAALVSRDAPADLLRSLFDGELAATVFDDRAVFLAIAGRCVFVVALAGEDVRASREAAAKLRDSVDRLIQSSRATYSTGWVPPIPGGASGSSSPAEAVAWPPRPRGSAGNN